MASDSDDEQPVRKKEHTIIPETQEAEQPKQTTPEEDAPNEDPFPPLVIDSTQFV